MDNMRSAFLAPFVPFGGSRCVQQRRRRVCRACPRMSGVNGGIDYDIDLAALPSDVAARVRYVQGGPDSPTELIAAARSIADGTRSHPDLLPVLVDMLGFNNPVAANIAVDALSEAGSAAVPPLLSGVAAFNYAVNAYALRALGRIGDPSVLDVCVQCAEKGPIPNVRRAACRALAGLKIDSTDDARRAHDTLVVLVNGEPDWGVRYAAIVGLECFASVAALPPGERGRGIEAVRAAAETTSSVLGKDSRKDGADVPLAIDPTVVARATVALAALEGGVGSKSVA